MTEKHIKSLVTNPYLLLVLSVLGLALPALGVTESKVVAILCLLTAFVIGSFGLVGSTKKWRIENRRRSNLLLVAIWLALLVAVYSYAERSRRAEISSSAFYAGVGNLPERKTVPTWDGRPWDESMYADVRLSITNQGDEALQNVDLNLSFDKDTHLVFTALGQLSDVNGVRLGPPSLPEWHPVPLEGSDHHIYFLPVPKMPFASKTYKVFIPRLESSDALRLIVGVGNVMQVKNTPPTVPSKIYLDGSAEAPANEGSKKFSIHEVVEVKR